MNDVSGDSGKTVLSYINALDSGNFDLAAEHIAENVRIIGPAGESFGKPKDFTNMLSRYHGKYSILKVFADGNDVCLIYDFITAGKVVYMSSWYRVETGRITFIRTIFDPSAFSAESE